MEQQIAQLYKPLLGYINKRVPKLEDAEDLTQEVFYKLSKSTTNTPKSVKSWVYTIAKNTITDYYRKRKIPTSDVSALTEYVQESGSKNTVEELSHCVTQFVHQLPEDYRRLMILSELEEVPQKEIAQRLNMNYVTVRSKIQRGRKKLKGLFANCCTIKQGGKGSILAYEAKNNERKDTHCCS